MTATRQHGRQTFVALFFGLHVAGRTGILEVRRGRNWRRIWIARGRPVRYKSSLEGDAGGSDPAQLERASVSPLLWADGTWTFTEADTVTAAIDPSLLPAVQPLRALWHDIRHQIDMEEAAGFVSDPDAGDVRANGQLAGVLASFGVEGALAELGDHLPDEGLPVDELFRKTKDKSGALLHLLWTLETIGMVRRTGREPDPVLAMLARGEQAGEQVDPDQEAEKVRQSRQKRAASSSQTAKPRYRAASSGLQKKPSAETLKNLPRLLRTAREHRIQKDFYAFLDLKPSAQIDDVEAAYKRLATLWRGAAQTEQLPMAARKDAHDLVQGALIVWKTLSDPDKRTEYDKRLRQGRAPTLESQIAVKSGSAARASKPGAPAPKAMGGGGEAADKSARARKLIDRGEFGPAIQLLRALRLDNPSDPDVLADLGWATWRMKGQEESDNANEFLQLALTFDPTHARGLQYLARLAKEQGRDADARRMVERLLAVDPKDDWARRALKSFDRAAAAASSGRRGRKRGR